MTETKNTNTEKDLETQMMKEIEEEMRLDDARRVKGSFSWDACF